MLGGEGMRAVPQVSSGLPNALLKSKRGTGTESECTLRAPGGRSIPSSLGTTCR